MIDGDFKATTVTGNIIKTTAALIYHKLNLFRNMSFDPVETMALWKESKAAVESVTVMTITIPTTHAGSCFRSKKKEMEPSEVSPANAPELISLNSDYFRCQTHLTKLPKAQSRQPGLV